MPGQSGRLTGAGARETDLLGRVRTHFRTLPWPAGTGLVALSGGGDSWALLHLLTALSGDD